jgi:plastocyanin
LGSSPLAPPAAARDAKGSVSHEGAASPGTPAPTWADFHRLQAEVREQRQLLIQLMQTEQQRYDMLLRLIQGPGRDPRDLPTVPQPGPPPRAAAGNEKGTTATAAKPREHARRFGAIVGKVTVSGGDLSSVYVYVEDVRAAPARGRTFEIKQEGKQFIPRHGVVQVGTTVSFPNLDPIFHNVFSPSARNTFDLGTYRAGDSARSVVLSHAGVVDIFCNMHQRMSASVLVVPNRLYSKVASDGAFRIEGVPVGERQVVAWGPNLKPERRAVELSDAETRTSFALEYTEKQAHSNKLGQAYGSYKE